ncbi:hypothetical protein EUGRSUZ_K03283 [Eucalyptus grandis]|uniref:Uncharacterized protein n=2 Tax=Eucalyptus grandis TaxID=71139 RepID=A0ACC3IZ76_EUCGR|nr:hypothetical protein EUGRSUZ_K03283 [Eucalyptus grandis]
MACFSRLQSRFLFFLITSMLFFEVSKAGGKGSLRPEACDYRCLAASHQMPRLFFCSKYCAKCLCVPSGAYGHMEERPCYDNWTTKEGKPKCP